MVEIYDTKLLYYKL